MSFDWSDDLNGHHTLNFNFPQGYISFKGVIQLLQFIPETWMRRWDYSSFSRSCQSFKIKYLILKRVPGLNIKISYAQIWEHVPIQCSWNDTLFTYIPYMQLK